MMMLFVGTLFKSALHHLTGPVNRQFANEKDLLVLRDFFETDKLADIQEKEIEKER
jgi:hypothetical protein